MTLLLASSSSTLHRLHRFLLLASSDPARSSPVSCFSPGFSYAVVASVNSSHVSPDASSSTCLLNSSSSQHIYNIIIINHPSPSSSSLSLQSCLWEDVGPGGRPGRYATGPGHRGSRCMGVCRGTRTVRAPRPKVTVYLRAKHLYGWGASSC